MARSHQLRFWFALALSVILVAAGALWLRGTLFESVIRSPLSTPQTVESPLSTPTEANAPAAPPASWSNGGMALLWVMIGILLSLGVAFFITRWGRRSEE